MTLEELNNIALGSVRGMPKTPWTLPDGRCGATDGHILVVTRQVFCGLQPLQERYIGRVMVLLDEPGILLGTMSAQRFREQTGTFLDWQVCVACQGSGKAVCHECNGSGEDECQECGSDVECQDCEGSGETACKACRGIRKVIPGSDDIVPVKIGSDCYSTNLLRRLPASVQGDITLWEIPDSTNISGILRLEPAGQAGQEPEWKMCFMPLWLSGSGVTPRELVLG